MNISLSPFAPENLVSRDEFGSPVPRQPSHLCTQAESIADRFDLSTESDILYVTVLYCTVLYNRYSCLRFPRDLSCQVLGKFVMSGLKKHMFFSFLKKKRARGSAVGRTSSIISGE